MFDTVQFSSGRCVALRSLRFVHITRSSLPTPELFTSSYTSSKASSTKRLSHTYTYPHPPHRYPTIHVGEAVTTNLGRIGRMLLLSTRPKTRQHCQAITEYVTAALYNTWTTTREWALRYTYILLEVGVPTTVVLLEVIPIHPSISLMGSYHILNIWPKEA